jgi:hypothetical protein
LPLLQDTIRGGRRIPSPNSKAWTDSIRGWWTTELRKLSIILLNAISAPSQINLFNACFALLCTPGLLLSNFFPNRNKHGDSRLRSAR